MHLSFAMRYLSSSTATRAGKEMSMTKSRSQPRSAAPRILKMLAACGTICVPLLGGACLAEEPAATEPQAIGAPPQIRRLTELQYRATVADIFGPDIPIVGRFEHGLRAEGLLAVGTSQAGISSFSIEQYDASARGIAAEVVSEKRREQLVPCLPRSEKDFDAVCAKQFVEHYGPTLFRRPLTGDEVKRYVATAEVAQRRLGNFYEGLQFALAGMLVSPDFLVRLEQVVPDPKHRGQLHLDPYAKASRLSFFLTNSTPDAELLRAAGAGELDTDAGLARQADRLIASPHYERAVRAFFGDMLEFDTFNELAKDPVIYPAFNSTVALDAQEQTMHTIVALLVTQPGDYRDLFTTQQTYLTRALGAVYKLPVATRNGWEKAQYPAGSGREGILTNVSFLAFYSHPGRSSSTLRGKAIRQVFLCQTIPDPPNNVDFSVVQDSSNTAMPTARIRLEAHRTSPACAGCHRLMDPLGLTLENFDGVGAFRAQENGAVIDASGTFNGHDYQGAQGLGQAIHDSPQTPRCLVDKMYRSAVGRKALPDERPYLDYLNQTFQADSYRVPNLMRAIAVSRSFYAISAPTVGMSSPQQHAAVHTSNGGHS
jgi:Protein of unknown function (DUF1592)/Protein of unknown function (DUF1588)/Protein of unknown function (DUF1595)/Protein of unknown function (DUF1585)/Protein of unknown function (DUF1587)